jgi:hypothetical protein
MFQGEGKVPQRRTEPLAFEHLELAERDYR